MWKKSFCCCCFRCYSRQLHKTLKSAVIVSTNICSVAMEKTYKDKKAILTNVMTIKYSYKCVNIAKAASKNVLNKFFPKVAAIWIVICWSNANWGFLLSFAATKMGERYKNKGKHTAPQTRIINIARVGASYNAKSMVINQLETNEIDIMFTFFLSSAPHFLLVECY